MFSYLTKIESYKKASDQRNLREIGGAGCAAGGIQFQTVTKQMMDNLYIRNIAKALEIEMQMYIIGVLFLFILIIILN